MTRRIEDKDLEKVSGAGDPTDLQRVGDPAPPVGGSTGSGPKQGGGGAPSNDLDADAGSGSGTPGGTTNFGQ